MSQPATRISLLLLPGLDGTGRLFTPFARCLERSFDATVITYPPDRLRNYEELSAEVARALPEPPFFIIAESFSGPVALKVAAREPPGLKAVILTASFVSNPRPWISLVFGTLIGLAVPKTTP